MFIQSLAPPPFPPLHRSVGYLNMVVRAHVWFWCLTLLMLVFHILVFVLVLCSWACFTWKGALQIKSSSSLLLKSYRNVHIPSGHAVHLAQNSLSNVVFHQWSLKLVDGVQTFGQLWTTLCLEMRIWIRLGYIWVEKLKRHHSDTNHN